MAETTKKQGLMILVSAVIIGILLLALFGIFKTEKSTSPAKSPTDSPVISKQQISAETPTNSRTSAQSPSA